MFKHIKEIAAGFLAVVLVLFAIALEAIIPAIAAVAVGVYAAERPVRRFVLATNERRRIRRELRALGVPAGAAQSLIEQLNFYNASLLTAHEDIFNGDPATDVVSMAGYQEMLFVIVKSAGATGTATITVESCDDTTPTTSTAITFRYKATTSGNTEGAVTAAAAAGFATTAGANQCYVISVKADELNGSDGFVRMVMTELVDGACDGGVVTIGGSPRYAAGSLLDMTS